SAQSHKSKTACEGGKSKQRANVRRRLRENVTRAERLQAAHERLLEKGQGMTLRTRLKRLEHRAKRLAPEEKRSDSRTGEAWLDRFESWGREGFFDSEPDYPEALACYRDALQKAKAQAEPSWDPPEEFLPRAEARCRLFEWQHGGTF